MRKLWVGAVEARPVKCICSLGRHVWCPIHKWDRPEEGK